MGKKPNFFFAPNASAELMMVKRLILFRAAKETFFFFFFFFKFLSGPRSILWSHWLLLFWTSCVLPHGFQIQSGYLACTLSCLHAVILKVTSGVTPAFSTYRGVHCISMYMAWRPVTFPTCHICNSSRLPGFDRETSCTVSRRALHSATATGLQRKLNIAFAVLHFRSM